MSECLICGQKFKEACDERKNMLEIIRDVDDWWYINDKDQPIKWTLEEKLQEYNRLDQLANKYSLLYGPFNHCEHRM